MVATTQFGTAENDNFDGGDGQDVYQLRQGGDDTVNGEGGNDIFRMGGTFTEADHLTGGSGWDKVVLEGDYSDGVTLSSEDVSGIERFRLQGSFDYNITVENNAVDGGDISFNGVPITGGHGMTINAGNLTFAQSVEFYGSSGDDVLTGGEGGGHFYLTQGGDDSAGSTGFESNNTFYMGAALTSADQLDGGEGYDLVWLNGDYTGGHKVVFTDTTMHGIDRINLQGGHSYDLTLAADTIDSFVNPDLHIDAHRLSSTEFAKIDASAVTGTFAGILSFKGGQGNDIAIGGSQGDVLDGRGGNDILTGGGFTDTLKGGSGKDTFVYLSADDSHGQSHDFVEDFHALKDQFDLDIGVSNAPGAIPIIHGSVDSPTFDTDMANAIGSVAAHTAEIVHPTGGSYKGFDLLFIDANGNGSYDSAADYVIDITGYQGVVTASDFI